MPTGVKIFNWVATLWRGTVEWRVPLLFSVGGIATFLMGGITGIFLAVFPVDWQLHDTYFVVAHFHYTAFGAAAFAMVAALYYWFPKMTGRLMSEGLGKISFALFFIGFHLTFLIQHSAGLDGMPRRSTSTERRLDDHEPDLDDRGVRARPQHPADGPQRRPLGSRRASIAGPTRGRRTRSSGSRRHRRPSTTSTWSRGCGRSSR